MNLRTWIMIGLAVASSGLFAAPEDPGKTKIARVCVSVYYATDADQKAAAAGSAVPKETTDRLRKEQQLRFKHYRVLGQDTQALLRSYESWAQPLKPSDEVLVRFESKGKPNKKTVLLDLELWLGRKKILKTDAALENARPLFMLGPEWRGGRLIIAVGLAPEHPPGS